MRCFGCLGAILAALAVFEWSIKGPKPAIESLSCCREQTVFPHPNIPSCYLEPDPLYSTRSFSELNPEWFKSASSRNHPRPSEASCLPNQAGFEASCLQHQAGKEGQDLTIIPILCCFLFRVPFVLLHTRVCACVCVYTHTQTHTLPELIFSSVYQFELEFHQYFLRFSNSSSINLQPSRSLCSAEIKGSRLPCLRHV